ncbi:pyridoxamine 5'-phosphate oxidase family protein [uncultured Ruminococcus sp.]|uniref:pyridoxamine 5'-phosphate oxidase family protein n=1 Tax=uncultured Ruminococcus sp. TaxID=165186 RepID=UPI00292F9B45|nr:pyridoxamine 5'-phosphate oxidase family protein [uncultured Ruminococcus sp.]
MTDFENAVCVMKERFGRDYQFALSTCVDNIPSSRFVDTYFDGESFYIVTYRLSRKAAEIAANLYVSLCSRQMNAFSGKAHIIGHPLDPENAQIRSELIKVFEPWYFKHNNEADKNMCYIRIDPTAGFFHQDGTGYQINFTEKTVRAFPFTFDTLLTEE